MSYNRPLYGNSGILSPSYYQTPSRNLDQSTRYIDPNPKFTDSKSKFASQYGTPNPFDNKISSSQIIPGITRQDLDRDLREIQERYQAEAQEVQKSYQTYQEMHAKLSRTIQELEALLEEERRKNSALEERYSASLRDIDHERRIRIDLEHDNAGLREEIKRKEGIISELDFKCAKYESDLSHVTSDNNGLRGEINRLSELYNSKLRDVEERYLGQVRDLTGQVDTLRGKIEQLTVDHSNHVRQITSEWDSKQRRLDDSIREKDRIIAELEAELRAMTDHISKLKVEFEDEIRRQINLTREDEKNRWQMVIKDLEAQIRETQDEKESALRKNQDVIRDLQTRERQLQDLRIQYDGDVARLKNEANDLRRQLEMANVNIDKLRNEVTTRDAHIGRLESEINNLRREIDRVKELGIQEVNRIITNHNNEVRRWEDVERALKAKITDQEKHLRNYEDDLNRLRNEYDRLRDSISGNLNKTITQTFVDHQGYSSSRKSFI